MQLDFVGSVVHAAARADLDVLPSSSGGDHDLSFERLVSKGRVDGVINMEIRVEDARVGSLRRSGLPFVAIGHTDADDQMSWIDIDYAGLIRSYVRHLADLGHRKVALVSRSPELVTAGYGPARRAREGFSAAVAERGLHGVEVMCGDDGRSGQECVEQLLHEHADLTAITTINEAALPGIQRALADAGLRAPTASPSPESRHGCGPRTSAAADGCRSPGPGDGREGGLAARRPDSAETTLLTGLDGDSGPTAKAQARAVPGSETPGPAYGWDVCEASEEG